MLGGGFEFRAASDLQANQDTTKSPHVVRLLVNRQSIFFFTLLASHPEPLGRNLNPLKPYNLINP